MISELEVHLKEILPSLVSQLPHTTVTYSQLLASLLCVLTIKLNKFEASMLRTHENKVAVFSCTLFDDNPQLAHDFDTIARQSSIMNIRVLEIFVKIAAVSQNHLVSISEPVFELSHKMSELLNSPDILSKLNVIELLARLAVTYHGYTFLESHGFLKLLLRDLIEAESNPFGSLMQPAIVKLFSQIGREMPAQLHADFPQYFEILFQYALYECSPPNELIVNLALQTFAFLFESNVIKKFIHENYEPRLFQLLNRLGWIINNLINEDFRSNALNCAARVLAADAMLLRIEETDTKWLESPWILSMSELTQLFYKQMVDECSSEVLLNNVFVLAKQPFPSTRLAAQELFKALAQTKWGLRLLLTENKYFKPQTFINYLLNRSFEIEKHGLESKFELVKLVVANVKLNCELFELIRENNMEALEAYVRSGAFYTQTESRVTFESI